MPHEYERDAAIHHGWGIVPVLFGKVRYKIFCSGSLRLEEQPLEAELVDHYISAELRVRLPAFFGRENRLGVPQPALSMDLGTATNVNSLSFTNDALAPIGAKGSFVEPITKTSIPIPPLPSLRTPPLALSPAAARRTTLMRQTASQNPGQAATTALAATTRAPDAVSVTGQVDTVRYGSVLRARRLVGVRGAGLRNDGLYYVRRVTHEIEVGKYTQNFTLSREGTGTLLPVVRP